MDIKKRLDKIESDDCAIDVVKDAIHYFIFSNKDEDNVFINSYKHGYVNNYDDEEKVYLTCSEYLYNDSLDNDEIMEDWVENHIIVLAEKISPFLCNYEVKDIKYQII